MSPLNGTSVQGAKRLLELFPITVLREVWKLIGTKEEVCQAIADQQTHQTIVNFVDSHLSCCKQHIYVFDLEDDLVEFPAEVSGQPAVKVERDHALYILRAEYRVVLKDPYEDATLEFLWPVRLEVTDSHFLARVVVLEKNLASYFERPYLLNDRGADEKDIVSDLAAGLGLKPADLHAGVKALWVENYMDSSRARYKKAKSTASEAMDEERGIKEQDPGLYAILLDSVLFSTLFTINAAHERATDLTVRVVSVDPSSGYIGFPRYADRVGDTDRVVREILTKNQ